MCIREKNVIRHSEKLLWIVRATLVALWQVSVLEEAHESTVSPQACIRSRVVDASSDSSTDGVAAANLAQVVFDSEAGFFFEESKTREDATDVAWCDAFGGEDALLVFCHEGRCDAQLNNALFAGTHQVFLALQDVFCWSLVERNKSSWKILFFVTGYRSFMIVGEISYSNNQQSSDDEEFHDELFLFKLF